MSWLRKSFARLGKPRAVTALAGLAAAGMFSLCEAHAQGQQNVRGTVRSMTTAPRGEVDGAVLDDGTVLHWPPHLEGSFKAVAAVGDQVQAVGQTETGPAGDTHFEVARLTNVRSNAVADNGRQAPPPPPRGPRGRAAASIGAAETVTGVVRSMTTAPRGEVDGAILDNGSTLHWPPHLENAFTRILNPGDRVRATGRTETAPRGEVHFEVQSVTNVQTGATVENDDLGPPPPPARERRRREPAPPARQSATVVRGVVRSLTTAPRGEVDGAILDDGTVLHWPPHLQDQFKNQAAVGESVTATGQTETAPRGEVHFEVQSLTSQRAGAASEGAPANAARNQGDREARLRALEQQVSQLQAEIERLRRQQP